MGALAFVAGATLLYGHTQKERGRTEVRVAWQQDIMARQAQYEAAMQQQRQQARQTEERNREVIREYESQLADAARSSSTYQRLLREARSEVHRLTTAEDAGTAGTATASATRGDGEIDALLAATLAERDANDAQLAALIDVVEGQL